MMKLNPRKIERMMKQMGMQAVEIDAEEVVIKTQDKDIVISQPQVTKINMMGQETFQIIGQVEEKPKKSFTENDVQLVMKQTGASEEEARKALEETNGDLAQSILKLKKS
jgi:nascent polypeptide-associated complex subunit alpha